MYNVTHHKVVFDVFVSSIVTQVQTKRILFKERISKKFLYFFHKYSIVSKTPVVIVCSYPSVCSVQQRVNSDRKNTRVFITYPLTLFCNKALFHPNHWPYSYCSCCYLLSFNPLSNKKTQREILRGTELNINISLCWRIMKKIFTFVNPSQLIENLLWRYNGVHGAHSYQC